MLKEDDDNLKTNSSLPVAKPVQRKQNRNLKKKSYLLSTDKNIAELEEEHNKKLEILAEKDRKRKQKQVDNTENNKYKRQKRETKRK